MDVLFLFDHEVCEKQAKDEIRETYEREITGDRRKL